MVEIITTEEGSIGTRSIASVASVARQIGRGTIDFESFYAALMRHAPQAILSLEAEDNTDVKMGDLRALAAHFAPT